MILSSLIVACCTFGNSSLINDEEQLDAVRKVVALGRDVKRVCDPRYLTTPVIPVEVVPPLPITSGRAQKRRVGGYQVVYGSLHGIVIGESVSVTFRRSEGLPEGARRRTEAECTASARSISNLVKADGYQIGKSFTVYPDETSPLIRTEIVLPRDPRFVAGVVDLRIDPHTGLPERVTKGTKYPPVASDRLNGILDEEALVTEALKVYRSLPGLSEARVARSSFVYEIPAFSDIVNEMTPELRERESRGEAVPLYQWAINSDDGTTARTRVVWVDARTGKGVAYLSHDLPWAGRSGGSKAILRTEGRWYIGRASGTLTKTTPATFEGVPVVVTNAKREVLTLRFDAKTGLVRDESGTYRPDAALVKALRAQEPVRAFGKG